MHSCWECKKNETCEKAKDLPLEALICDNTCKEFEGGKFKVKGIYEII